MAGFFIFEFLWLLVRTNGFGMSRDGYGRSRGWRWWRRQRLEDWVSGCLVVVVAARSAWLWMIFLWLVKFLLIWVIFCYDLILVILLGMGLLEVEGEREEKEEKKRNNKERLKNNILIKW